MAIEPMTPATLGRLMDTPDSAEDLEAERLREAHQRGRQAGMAIAQLAALVEPDDVGRRMRLAFTLAALRGRAR